MGQLQRRITLFAVVLLLGALRSISAQAVNANGSIASGAYPPVYQPSSPPVSTVPPFLSSPYVIGQPSVIYVYPQPYGYNYTAQQRPNVYGQPVYNANAPQPWQPNTVPPSTTGTAGQPTVNPIYPPSTAPQPVSTLQQPPSTAGQPGSETTIPAPSGIPNMPNLQPGISLPTMPNENPPVFVTTPLAAGTVIVKPFGYDFFDISSAGFQPINNVPPPAEYPLGPGDYVRVVMTSTVGQQTDVQLLVDAFGRIQIPSVGLVKVSGATIGTAQNIIAREVKSRFPALTTQVILTSIRPIQVFVVGRVKRPGAYILPGLSTLLNALYSAGGPSINGSLRTITVSRNKKTVATIDLYELLMHGNRAKDVTLQSGDSVFIPSVGPTVTVVGEVKQAAIYELVGAPTIQDVIRMAGGASGGASLSNVRVERILGSSKKVLVDLALASANAPDWTFPVQNGDTVMVRPVLDDAANRVEIIGQIKRPGSYELADKMTVSDLVRRAEGFSDEEIFLDRATIIRTRDTGEQELLSTNLGSAMARADGQDIELMPRDRVIVYSRSEAASLNRTVQIQGEVSRPGVYVRKEGMRLRDLIIAAGGSKPEAYSAVEIARSEPAAAGAKTSIVKVNLAQAMGGKETDNILLSDGDQIAVRNRSDAQTTAEVVTISGEVQYPGPYALLTRN
ncbi:MAG: SLBB domain-containing protein, partial [Armatimonadota bacterium]